MNERTELRVVAGRLLDSSLLASGPRKVGLP